MALRKLQVAGATALDAASINVAALTRGRNRATLNTKALNTGELDSVNLTGDTSSKGAALLYGAVAVGVVAGAAISTYLWRQRVRALNLLNMTPLERAEEIIANCESKLEDIERAFENLKAEKF